MELKRTSNAVYDNKYHLVWTPKYRKWILKRDIRKRVQEKSPNQLDLFELCPALQVGIFTFGEAKVQLHLDFPCYMDKLKEGCLDGQTVLCIFELRFIYNDRIQN